MKLKKNVKIALAAAGALCVVLVVWLVASKGKTDQNTDANPSSASAENQTATADSSKKEDTKDKEDEEKTQNESNETGEKTGSDQNGNDSYNTEPVNISVSLPYTLPNSSLVAEDIRSFDGMFVEDGSDEEVSGVAVLILTNKGNTPVEYADIELGDYQFIASAIAPGATVIVQEKDGKEYTSQSSYTCTTHVANINSFDYSDDVTIAENEDSITVTNVSGVDIPCVRIFYKLHMEDDDIYVGGITYTAKITDLKADSSVTITPSHYLQGYSEIMMVRTYDTAE
ncbi:MAG: hypothetical protein E7185_00340 [Erysipelotrichaceae bacterium]|nr:hypothetical protein [Erysipelotrichaceae bacterium]